MYIYGFGMFQMKLTSSLRNRTHKSVNTIIAPYMYPHPILCLSTPKIINRIATRLFCAS